MKSGLVRGFTLRLEAVDADLARVGFRARHPDGRLAGHRRRGRGAFLIALSLPNMFRRFFAEGAFNTAFVPMFLGRSWTIRPTRSVFAREAFSGLFMTVLALSAVATSLLACRGLVWPDGVGVRGR